MGEPERVPVAIQVGRLANLIRASVLGGGFSLFWRCNPKVSPALAAGQVGDPHVAPLGGRPHLRRAELPLPGSCCGECPDTKGVGRSGDERRGGESRFPKHSP